MKAQNLIEILEACAYNAGVSLDELDVKVSDVDGCVNSINGYNIFDCDADNNITYDCDKADHFCVMLRLGKEYN